MDKEKPNILYVDDESLNLSSFKYLYKKYYNIHLANSAKDALKILDTTDIKVVITDQRMPEVTGVEFLEMVADKFPRVIRIMLTGYSNTEDTIQAINRGEVYRYVSKPFDELDFRITIDKAIELYDLKLRNIQLMEELEKRVDERTKELFDSEARYKAIFSNASAAIVLTDNQGHFLQANSAWSKMIGYSLDEIRQFTIEDITYKEDIKISKRYFELLVSKQIESFQLEKRYVRKDGTVFWGDVSTSVFFTSSNNQRNVLAIVHDITERKKAEHNLQKNERELRQLNQKLLFYIQETPLAYIELNNKFEIVDWNPAAERVFGFSRHEILSQNIFNKLITQNFRIQFDNHIKNLILEKDAKNFVAVNVRKDGKEIICDWYNTTLVNENGKLIGLACLALDISERIRSEKEIIETNKALRKAKEEADRANKTKSEFLANMSHEIRTPMNAIMGFTELLDSLIVDETQRHYLSSIKSSGKTLLTLINDILDLSKVEAGKLKLNYEFMNLHQLVDELKSIFSKSIEEKGLDFYLEINSKIPLVLLDEIRLRQILINLIGNAIKFTKKGFVLLSVRSQKHPSKQDFIELYFSVQDTGTGISIEDQEVIFNAFTQKTGQDQAEFGGTGLGLTISSRLAQMMGGKITIESEVGQGSNFTVFFPEIKIEELSKEEKLTITKDNFQKPNFQGLSILVVDDIQSNNDILRGFLRGTNIEIFEASNGSEALEIIRQKRPSLIVLDIRMPVMGGVETVKILKSQENLKHIPVIALTASALEDEKIKNEFDVYLRKPVKRKVFITEIEKFLNKNQIQLENYLKECLKSKYIKEINEVFTILARKMTQEWNECRTKMIFSDIENFSKKLKEIGSKYELPFLSSLGDRLETQSRKFDIVSLPYTLDEFSIIVEKIKIFIEESQQL